MNSLTGWEKLFFELYKNYSKNIKDPEFKLLDQKWTRDGTKERTWIEIYNKIEIDSHIETLLFIPKFNESIIISEMDTYIAGSFGKLN
jgi:hypothetical protein